MMAARPDGAGNWDAGAYDRLSGPQYAWGQRVLDRLGLRGDETVLDAGCGTGRLTALLLVRLPHGKVIAVDKSEAMLAEARSNLQAYQARVHYFCADLQTLELRRPVDAVFSTATFPWISDHARLFQAMAPASASSPRALSQHLPASIPLRHTGISSKPSSYCHTSARSLRPSTGDSWHRSRSRLLM